jgi:hypothetical protein
MRGELTRSAAGIFVSMALACLGSAQTTQAAAAVVRVPCSVATLAADMNSAGDGETLSLAARCVYQATDGLPVLNDDLVIEGNGATLAGEIQVDSGTTSISMLNFRNGGITINDIGNVIVNGGIFSSAFIDDFSALGGLTANGSTFTGSDGTVLYDFSATGAVVTDSVFYDNGTAGGASAIVTDANSGTYLAHDMIYGNRAEAGGAIDNITNVSLVDCQVFGNSATSEGGGIYNANDDTNAYITGTAVRGNRAQDGAGIYNNGGIVSVASSQLYDNAASGFGGGIANEVDDFFAPSYVTFTSSEISGNHAGAQGGGIYNEGEVIAATTRIAGNTAASMGGGIDDVDGGDIEPTAVMLTSSPVVSNEPDNCRPAGSIADCTG